MKSMSRNTMIKNILSNIHAHLESELMPKDEAKKAGYKKDDCV